MKNLQELWVRDADRPAALTQRLFVAHAAARLEGLATHRRTKLRAGDGTRRGGGLTAISRINDLSTTDGLFTEGLMAGIVQESGLEVVAGLDDFLQKKSWRLEVADRSDVIDATRVHDW
jgi:hypothetical protein